MRNRAQRRLGARIRSRTVLVFAAFFAAVAVATLSTPTPTPAARKIGDEVCLAGKLAAARRHARRVTACHSSFDKHRDLETLARCESTILERTQRSLDRTDRAAARLAFAPCP